MAFKKVPAEHRFIITPARPGDAQIASRLICMAMGEVASFIFGLGSSKRAAFVLERLFEHDANIFSYRYAKFAKTQNGDIAGILIAYPRNRTIGLHTSMARQLFYVYGIINSFIFLRNGLILLLSAFSTGQLKTRKQDEYYISTLAVLPEYRGMGIGSMLLADAEDDAKKAGFKKCSLGVDIDNDRALRLYKHLGYEIAETVKLKRFNRLIGSRGFFQMVKELKH